MLNAHALIIDDSVTNIEVMGEMLVACGMTYTALPDPSKIGNALESLDQLDVIFLDLEMPKIDGYTMLDILKDQIGLTVPVVASTVHLNEINTARELGFDGFVGKPLKIARFPSQVERILNGVPVWEPD